MNTTEKNIITIFKNTHLKTKTKQDVLIVLPDGSDILSAFDFLSKYVATDAVTKGYTIFSTEYGYNLIDSDKNIKFSFVIE